MNRIRKFNETNGPAYGKEETTKRGLKGIPLTSENPTMVDNDTFDDSIPNEDNMIDEDEPITIQKKKKYKAVKRTKKFKELYESISQDRIKEFYDRMNKMINDWDEGEDEDNYPSHSEMASEVGEIMDDMNLTTQDLKDIVAAYPDDTHIEWYVKPQVDFEEKEDTKLNTQRDFIRKLSKEPNMTNQEADKIIVDMKKLINGVDDNFYSHRY